MFFIWCVAAQRDHLGSGSSISVTYKEMEKNKSLCALFPVLFTVETSAMSWWTICINSSPFGTLFTSRGWNLTADGVLQLYPVCLGVPTHIDCHGAHSWLPWGTCICRGFPLQVWGNQCTFTCSYRHSAAPCTGTPYLMSDFPHWLQLIPTLRH